MASLQEKARACAGNWRFHPLTEPQFERMNSTNPPSYVSLKVPVVWNENVYALGRNSNGEGKLFKYSIANNDWRVFSIISSIYASGSVLTTYRSKLLLISGKDMTMWEFSSNDFVFEPFCVEPIPSTYIPHYFTDLTAISKDEYLIVFYNNMGNRSYLSLFQLIYDGRNWKHRQYKHIGFGSDQTYLMAIDSHAIVVLRFLNEFYRRRYRNDYDIDYVDFEFHKAPMFSFDDVEGTCINWEMLEAISCTELRALIYQGKFSTFLHNQQLYFVDSQGVILTSLFIRPPIVSVVWGNSGVTFQQAPHLVGLPNGAMLMIGMVGDQHGSQLDVIKVTQKDTEFKPDNHLTMKALVILEWGMNIPVLSELKSRLRDLKDRIEPTNTCAKHSYSFKHMFDRHTPFKLSFVIKYIKWWINSASSVQPTWRNFFGILKDISPELGQLAYQLKVLFHATETTDDITKLKADLVHLQNTCSSESAEQMVRELESSVAFCENILKKAQQADTERKQLIMRLLSIAKKVTELDEQLKLFKQAEEESKTRKLTEKDLPSLLCQLKKHTAKWKEIGIHLGFLIGELASIEARPNLSHSAPLSWFVAMLEDWLQWAPDDSRGSTSFATLEDLMDALRQAGLGASACDLKLNITM